MDLTIFTPTYNRRRLLERLYNSLLNQSQKDFEWLIVDDGSLDDTEEFINQLHPTNFKITYIKQENQGKHIAINTGAKAALGEWFFIVDSDDYLLPDAVEKLKHYINQCTDLKGFAGFCTNRIYPDGKQSGRPVKYDILDTDFSSYSIKYKYDGEHPACIRTRIWREFPFPLYENEKFCSEALVLRRIARKYKCRYYNDSVYVMEAYHADGLTVDISRHFSNSPRTSALFFKEQLDLKNTGIKNKIATSYNYWKHFRNIKNPPREIKPNLILYVAGLPCYYLCRLIKKFI